MLNLIKASIYTEPVTIRGAATKLHEKFMSSLASYSIS